MTSIKAKLRPSTVPGRPGSVFYSLVHRRTSKQITTRYKIYPHEWDPATERIVLPPNRQQCFFRRQTLLLLQQAIDHDLALFRRTLFRLEARETDYNLNDLTREYFEQARCRTLRAFSGQLVEELNRTGRFKTAMSYHYVVGNFLSFTGNPDIRLSAIGSTLICEYEHWLRSRNVSLNTCSFYMRTLRAIYNKAADRELISQQQPFKRVYTGVDKTHKRAIDSDIVCRIKQLAIPTNTPLALARDLFLFSIYTRGMAFVDIAYLRQHDLSDGFIRYRRHKTGQGLQIKIERCMTEIIKRYAPYTTSDYLFPILKSQDPTLAFHQYRNFLAYYNKLLKQLSRMIRSSVPLTSYTARHTWASLAHKNNIPISVISESMGHYSEQTTRIYLASLDQTTIDRANSIILNKL